MSEQAQTTLNEVITASTEEKKPESVSEIKKIEATQENKDKSI
jgi:hypothetical protein